MKTLFCNFLIGLNFLAIIICTGCGEKKSPSFTQTSNNHAPGPVSLILTPKMNFTGLIGIENPVKMCKPMQSCTEKNRICLNGSSYYICQHYEGNPGDELIWVQTHTREPINGAFTTFRKIADIPGNPNLAKTKFTINYNEQTYDVWLFIFFSFDQGLLANSWLPPLAFYTTCEVWKRNEIGTYSGIFHTHILNNYKIFKSRDDILKEDNLCEADKINGLEEINGKIYAEKSSTNPSKINIYFSAPALKKPQSLDFLKVEQKRVILNN